MQKTSDVQITKDNFLDSYRPVSPRRTKSGGDPAPQTEQQKMEVSETEAPKVASAPVLSRGKNEVVDTNAGSMTSAIYQEIFLRPNHGEAMRYGRVYYLSKSDRRKVKTILNCFGEEMENFPLSVFIHNLLEYHFEQFKSLILEMTRSSHKNNPF